MRNTGSDAARAAARKPPPARNWFEDTALWKLEVRFQFSGWLQYVLHAVWLAAFLLLAAIGWLIGRWPLILFWLPFGIAVFLAISLVGTLLIVKYGLHPAERIPQSKEDLDAFDLMRARHSCRSFQPRDLGAQHRAAVMEAVRVHSARPRLLGRGPIRFEYVAARLTVWPVVGAHEFLIAIAPKDYDRLSVIDVGRSLQKVVLDATRLGLATCWIGPGADQKSIIEHLGERFDPERDHVICVCAVGYESMFKPLFIRLMQKMQRRRLPLAALFFADPAFETPLDTRSAPYRDFGRCYEVCQWSPSSYNSQSTRCAAVAESAEGEDRLIRFDFCAATPSRYYAAVALGIWCANWEAGCAALERHGHFDVLSPEARRADALPEWPRYDLSWVID